MLKIAYFSNLPLFDAPAQGNPLEVLDETYPTKLQELGHCTVQILHDPNFNRFWLIHSCDGQTDRRTGDSI